MERLKNPKVVAALVVATLAVIVFLQNQAPATLNVLWIATVETTLATALSAAFLVGLVTGAVVFSWKTRREKSKSTSTAAVP